MSDPITVRESSKYLDDVLNNIPSPSVCQTINRFELDPTLLDLKLHAIIEKLINQYDLGANRSEIGDIFFTLAKVRGLSSVVTHFPVGVDRLVEILQDIQRIFQNGHKDEDPILTSDWVLYMQLAWLSQLCLITYPLNSIQPELDEKIYSTIYRISKYGMGKNQEIACLVFTNLISRPDCLTLKQTYLKTSTDEIDISTLMVLNKLLKRAQIQTSITEHIIRYKCSNAQELKFWIKVLGKIGVTTLSNNILNQIVHGLITMLNSQESSVRLTLAKQIAKIYPLLTISAKESILKVIMCDWSEWIRIDTNIVPYNVIHTSLLTIGFILLSTPVSQGTQAQMSYISELIYKITPYMLFYERKLINRKLGSEIKDSICFIIWSLSKHLKLCKTIIKWIEISHYLLVVEIYEKRNVSFRRACIHARRELIGRLNMDSEEKLALVTLEDIVSIQRIGDSRFAQSMAEVLQQVLTKTEFDFHAKMGLIVDLFQLDPEKALDVLVELKDLAFIGCILNWYCQNVDSRFTKWIDEVHKISLTGWKEEHKLIYLSGQVRFNALEGRPIFINEVFECIDKSSAKEDLSIISLLPLTDELIMACRIRLKNPALCANLNYAIGQQLSSDIFAMMSTTAVVPKLDTLIDIRKSLVSSCTLSRDGNMNEELLLMGLKDYTMNQLRGDVGSKVRYECLCQISLYISQNHQLSDRLLDAMFRLAVEPNDKIGQLALQCISHCLKTEQQPAAPIPSNGHIDMKQKIMGDTTVHVEPTTSAQDWIVSPQTSRFAQGIKLYEATAPKPGNAMWDGLERSFRSNATRDAAVCALICSWPLSEIPNEFIKDKCQIIGLLPC